MNKRIKHLDSFNGYQEAFIISDIHGCYSQMLELLKNWDKTKQYLIFNGDYVDRGPDSLKVLQKIRELKLDYPSQVFFNLGNHDDVWLNLLKEGKGSDLLHYLVQNGGKETILSFLGRDTEIEDMTLIQSEILKKHERLLQFFADHHYLAISLGNLVVAHASVNLKDWTNSSKDTFIWGRGIENEPNNTDKVFVFGHTPTPNINWDRSGNPYLNDRRNIIMIDGGAAYGHQLNAVALHASGCLLKTLSVYSQPITYVNAVMNV